jgi:hemolysin III
VRRVGSVTSFATKSEKGCDSPILSTLSQDDIRASAFPTARAENVGCGPDGCPRGLNWDYDRNELVTDGVVHVIGLMFAIIGLTVMTSLSWPLANDGRTWAIAIYGSGLAAMLGFSAAYNLWPVGPMKWRLRRLDHSAIFVFIAATYTPLISHLKSDLTTALTLAGVWIVAFLGVLLKVFLPGRFDRCSIAVCLLLGGSGLFIYEPALATLPSTSHWLIAIGGAIYASGIVFHLWESLRFQNAIWHSFVLAAAMCHYAAILCCGLPTGT